MMRERFLPAQHEQILYNQYQNCRQGVRGTADYTKEFHRLGERMNLAEGENHVIAQFVGGLWSDIKEKVRVEPITFLSDTIS